MSAIVQQLMSYGGSGALNGALVYRTALQTAGVILWTDETYDIGGWHSTSGDTERLTVPAGVSIARVIGSYENGSPNSINIVSLLGGATYRGMLAGGIVNLTTQPYGISAPVVVSAGNIFTIDSGDTAVGADTVRNFASIEALSSSLKYALVYKSSTQAYTATAAAAITFDSEVADTDGFHDNVTANSRLTVPSGVTRVRLCGNSIDNAVSGGRRIILFKNGSGTFVGSPQQVRDPGAVACRLNLGSPVLEVTAGDYFELNYASATNKTISNAEETWFSIEEVPDYSRCLVSKSTTQALSANTPTLITFDTEAYDTDAIHDAGDNTKLTVPAGKTYARISAGFAMSDALFADQCTLLLNGAAANGLVSSEVFANYNVCSMSFVSPWIPVVAGQYFQMQLTRVSGVGTVAVNRTYLGAEFR